MTDLDSRGQEAKARFVEERGTWGPGWESIARFDPGFLDAYRELSMVPWRKNHLEAKTKELLYIAVDGAATHLYLPGVRQHVRAALALGATPAEIMEVLELAATLGIHAMNIGVPILTDVLRERGIRTEPGPLDSHQVDMKAEFVEARGYWNAFWDDILELDPEMFAAFTAFSSVPWRTGTLEPKVKEFVYIAYDAAATHLYTKGLRLHFENALDLGATVGELLEVLEVASVLGIHAATSSAPILAEELEAQARHAEAR